MRLQCPGGLQLNVFNTHLHANYSHNFAASKLKEGPKANTTEGDKANGAGPMTTSGSKAGTKTATSENGASKAPKDSQQHSDSDPAYLTPTDSFGCFRVAQIAEMAHLISLIMRGHPKGSVILGGDLNCEPNTLEFRLLRQLLPQLKDAWLDTNGGICPWTALLLAPGLLLCRHCCCCCC